MEPTVEVVNIGVCVCAVCVIQRMRNAGVNKEEWPIGERARRTAWILGPLPRR